MSVSLLHQTSTDHCGDAQRDASSPFSSSLHSNAFAFSSQPFSHATST